MRTLHATTARPATGPIFLRAALLLAAASALATACLAAPAGAPAQQPAVPQVQASADTKAATKAGAGADADSDIRPDVALQIRIDTSRPQPYVGSGVGITAEFKNLSKRSVLFLRNDTTTLTLPPELEGPLQPMYGREAFFPSENDQWRANERLPEAKRKPIVVSIQPGETYRAVWVFDAQADRLSRLPKPPSGGQPRSTLWDEIAAELRYLLFVPGDYKVLVQARVGVGEVPVDGGVGAHTFSETALIKVAAPQFVIMFGAMVGGLIGLFLFPPKQPQTLAAAWAEDGVPAAARVALRWANSFAGACLLSAIVTILLARLSEGQFLVKINVSDFWGAIVVGFIAQYTGISILDRLLNARKQASEGKPQTQGAPEGQTRTSAAGNARQDGQAPSPPPAAPAAPPVAPPVKPIVAPDAVQT